MHDDDRPVGRFLSRRELVSFFGAAASGTLVARRASGGEQRIRAGAAIRSRALSLPGRQL